MTFLKLKKPFSGRNDEHTFSRNQRSKSRLDFPGPPEKIYARFASMAPITIESFNSSFEKLGEKVKIKALKATSLDRLVIFDK